MFRPRFESSPSRQNRLVKALYLSAGMRAYRKLLGQVYLVTIASF
jgi:hypothetical protein